MIETLVTITTLVTKLAVIAGLVIALVVTCKRYKFKKYDTTKMEN